MESSKATNNIISKNLLYELELIKKYIYDNQKNIETDSVKLNQNNISLSIIEQLLLQLDNLKIEEKDLNNNYKIENSSLDKILLFEKNIYEQEKERIRLKKEDIKDILNNKLKDVRLLLLDTNLKIRFYKNEKQLLEDKIKLYSDKQLKNRIDSISKIILLNKEKIKEKDQINKKKKLIDKNLKLDSSNFKLIELKKSLDDYKYNNKIGNYKLPNEYKQLKKYKTLLSNKIIYANKELIDIKTKIIELEELLLDDNITRHVVTDIERCETRYNIINNRILHRKNVLLNNYNNKMNIIKLSVNDFKNKIQLEKQKIITVDKTKLTKNNDLLNKIKNRKKYLMNILTN